MSTPSQSTKPRTYTPEALNRRVREDLMNGGFLSTLFHESRDVDRLIDATMISSLMVFREFVDRTQGHPLLKPMKQRDVLNLVSDVLRGNAYAIKAIYLDAKAEGR